MQIIQSSSTSTVELTVVGAGTSKYLDSLAKLAEESSVKLEMNGYKENPYEFIRSKVDLIVIPSLWEETLGRVAFEASNAGFPVLVSKIGGLSESASLAGKNYFEFEPGNSSGLAQEIVGFFNGENHGVEPAGVHRKLSESIIKHVSRLENNEAK